MQTQSNSSMRNKRDIDIPDLTGTLAVVTGANSGLGLGITRRLAAAGAEVILAVRNAEKGKQAIGDLLAENPRAWLSIELIDLASLRSVAEFSARLNASGRFYWPHCAQFGPEVASSTPPVRWSRKKTRRSSPRYWRTLLMPASFRSALA